MRRKRSPTAPARLYPLTQRQARWLTDARDTVGGAHVGLILGIEPYELVDAGRRGHLPGGPPERWYPSRANRARSCVAAASLVGS